MTPQEIASLLQSRKPGDYQVAFILGSGLGPLADLVRDRQFFPYTELPGFPKSDVSSHSGELVLGRLGGTSVALLSGRSHFYEHGNASIMSLPIQTMKALGCRNLVLTNAAGSVREDMPPGSLMLATDHINFSGRNPLIGQTGDDRFLDLSKAYDPDLARRFKTAAADLNITLFEGVYMWFSGPSFETPAEIRMARTLGADAIGMSTVPEVILGRYHGLKTAAISSITNFGAGMSDITLSHDHTRAIAAQNVATFKTLLNRFCEGLADET